MSAQKTYDRLKIKAEAGFLQPKRMPSIVQIHKLLQAVNIPHDFEQIRYEPTEYGTIPFEYKRMYRLKVKHLFLDTSDPTYPLNTWGFANELVSLIKEKQNAR